MVPSTIPRKTISNARGLRNNMTEGEKRLWQELRKWKKQFGIHIRRQAPIGRFITDFAIHDMKLIIEVDGEFHYTDKGLAHDEARDRWLNDEGYRIIRINTGELADNFSGCVESIMHEVGLMK